jgi:hypothetical protein
MSPVKKFFRGDPSSPDHHSNNRTMIILGLIFSSITTISVIGGGFYFVGGMNREIKECSKDIDGFQLKIDAANTMSLSAFSAVTSKGDQRTLDSAIKILNDMNNFVKMKNREQDSLIWFLMKNCKLKTRGESTEKISSLNYK